MKPRLIWGLFSILVPLALSSCGIKEGKPRSEFMQGCMSDGTSEVMCKCTWDQLKDRYGIDRLVGMNDTGIVPPDFLQAAIESKRSCAISIGHLSAEEVLGASKPASAQASQAAGDASQNPQLTPAQQAEMEAGKRGYRELVQGQPAPESREGTSTAQPPYNPYDINAENAWKAQHQVTTSDDLELTQYAYSVSAPHNCSNINSGAPIECSKVVALVPMLSPEQVKERWCENGVCMAKNECKHIVGADPIYLNPEKYGISDWGAYHDTNYKKHSDRTVCHQ